MRRPVRTITWPPICSRRSRLGEPTSPRCLRRHRRRLEAEPGLADRGRRLLDDRVLRSRGGWASERSNRGSSSSSPITSGASTRRACSSSSCPVSSPSSTTIVRESIGGGFYWAVFWEAPAHGAQRRLAPRRGTQSLPLPRRARKSDRRSGKARADRVARDPACLEGRLDLASGRLEAAGDRARRRRPPPVPLPPLLPGPAGAGQVRQARSVRGTAARSAPGDGRAHAARAVRARARLRGRGTADQHGLVPGRIRPLRQDLPHLRGDDA